MRTVKRLIEEPLLEALSAFPAVYLAGPRQSGKTTLCQHIATTRHPATYITFDDIQIRSSAQRDPEAFLRSFTGPVVLDEIQLVPELFRPLKIIVDENRNSSNGGRGRFLLTGSASVMALPTLSDALVGRMVLHKLLPLSVQEIKKTPNNFIEKVFSSDWYFEKLPTKNNIDLMIQASFPELRDLNNNRLRNEWCNGYINTILQRDIRALMEIEKIGLLPNMLHLLATRTGGLLNEASLARDSELNHLTAKRYHLLLENLFLIQAIPAWTNNLGKRLIKAPKIYLNDLNLFAYLINADMADLQIVNPILFGRVLENFVAIELSKQLTFSKIRATLYHYRTASGQEVDFLLEGPQNGIIGIEVKANTKVNAKDFQHLESLQQSLGNQFKRGFVLYQGTEILPFGKDLWAVPSSAL